MTNCIGFFGVMSSGKGVTSVKFLKDCIVKKPKRIISNCFLRLPEVTQISNDDIYLNCKNPEFFRDSYLYITEMHTILESRSSSSLVNKNFTQFLTQIGKLNTKVIYDSQLEGQIDVRMREFTPYRIICKRFVLRDGNITEPTFYDDRKLKEQIFIDLTLNWTNIWGKEMFKPLGMYSPNQDDFNLYNTEEIITLDREKYMRR